MCSKRVDSRCVTFFEKKRRLGKIKKNWGAIVLRMARTGTAGRQHCRCRLDAPLNRRARVRARRLSGAWPRKRFKQLVHVWARETRFPLAPALAPSQFASPLCVCRFGVVAWLSIRTFERRRAMFWGRLAVRRAASNPPAPKKWHAAVRMESHATTQNRHTPRRPKKVSTQAPTESEFLAPNYGQVV